MEENKENKFNFSEEEATKDEVVAQSKEAVKKDAEGLWRSMKVFLVELLDFRHDTDREATLEAIKGDIAFKGATAWILICSIFVASIGLNANSTAVVIGAMLISPLMGPILGIGMSIAINDIDTLKKSIINLLTMIVLSLLTAFLFFKFFPSGSQETSELLGRVRPDIRDVFIAFFGGLALIIARTKKGTIASVIFGVAIATALMPPLCTAGYGLANGNWAYFGGAMNLFTINTIFIALATFIVLKVLRFPMLRYANSAKRRRIANVASLVAIVVMVYPTITFIKVYKESRITNDYKNFVQNVIRSNESLWLQRETLDVDAKKISFFFNGEIDDATRGFITNGKSDYVNLKDFEISINANKNRSIDKISEAYDRAIQDLDEKENVIAGLQKEIVTLRSRLAQLQKAQNKVEFPVLAKDAKILFSDLEYFSYAEALESKDFINVDTVSVAIIQWKSGVADSVKIQNEVKMRAWLKTQLKKDSVLIKRQ